MKTSKKTVKSLRTSVQAGVANNPLYSSKSATSKKGSSSSSSTGGAAVNPLYT